MDFPFVNPDEINSITALQVAAIIILLSLNFFIIFNR